MMMMRRRRKRGGDGNDVSTLTSTNYQLSLANKGTPNLCTAGKLLFPVGQSNEWNRPVLVLSTLYYTGLIVSNIEIRNVN